MLKQPAPDVMLQCCEEEVSEELFNLETIVCNTVKVGVSLS